MKSNYFYQVVSLKEKLIFLTPPKCSTHSLKDFLIEGKIETNEPLNFPLNSPFYHPTLNEIVKAYNIKNLFDYKIIQITRNPYNRFISSYIHEQKLLKKEINLDNYISQVKQFKHLLPYNINAFYKNFYKTLKYKEFYYNENSWGGLRFYFEQNWWNNLKSKIFYFKLEDLNQDSTDLCNFLNIKNIKYPQINKLKYNSILLNENQKNIIYSLFKKDFYTFNYKK